MSLKLSAKARKTLKREHRLGATLSATATDPAGNKGTAKKTVKLS